MAKIKVTDEMYRTIPSMLREGKTREQIAEEFGVSATSLQVMCCKRGISLRRASRNLRHRVDLSLRVDNRVATSLNKAAVTFGKPSANRLISDLLSRIANDDLYKAVLDEEVA